MNNIAIFLIIYMFDIQLLAILCLIWVIQLGKGKSRKPTIEASISNLKGFHLSIRDKSMQYLIAILAWPLGSGLVIGLIRRFTLANWTFWFGAIFTIVWGAILFWIVLGLESSSPWCIHSHFKMIHYRKSSYLEKITSHFYCIDWTYLKTGKLLLCRTVLSSMNSIQKQIVKSAIDKYPNLLESMPK